jgi:hypothetical protein
MRGVFILYQFAVCAIEMLLRGKQNALNGDAQGNRIIRWL